MALIGLAVVASCSGPPDDRGAFAAALHAPDARALHPVANVRLGPA